MSAALQAKPSAAARIGRLVEIVLIFVVLGPPIGSFVWLMLLTISAGNPGRALTDLPLVPLAVLVFASIGYVYGAVPAALAGLAIGIKQAFFGRTTWPMALAVGLIAGVIFLEGLDVFNPRVVLQTQRFDGSPVSEFPAIAILTCLVPTMLCWSLVRGPYFTPPSIASTAP